MSGRRKVSKKMNMLFCTTNEEKLKNAIGLKLGVSILILESQSHAISLQLISSLADQRLVAM